MHFTTVSMLIYLSVAVITTIKQSVDPANKNLLWTENFLTGLFAIEYIIRCRPKFMGFWKKFRKNKKPVMFIADLITFAIARTVFEYGKGSKVSFMTIIAITRTIQRYLDYHPVLWRIFKFVLYKNSGEMRVIVFLMIVAMIAAPTILTRVEDDLSKVDLPLWSLITAVNIKYEDFVPESQLGKVVVAGYIVITKSLMMTAMCVLGETFLVKAQELEKRKRVDQKVAASLIQCFWRHHLRTTLSKNN